MTSPNTNVQSVTVHRRLTSGDDHSSLMTKREYFAAMAESNIDDWSAEGIERTFGLSKPTEGSDNYEWQKFWMSAEAKIKVMKADALIEQLNK